MTKYLLLKHYRGAPEAVNDVPMDQWTPQEIQDHLHTCRSRVRDMSGQTMGRGAALNITTASGGPVYRGDCGASARITTR